MMIHLQGIRQMSILREARAEASHYILITSRNPCTPPEAEQRDNGLTGRLVHRRIYTDYGHYHRRLEA